MKKCDYYIIQELVSKKVYDYYMPRYGEDFIWGLFQEAVLIDLDLIASKWREKHSSGVIINDWFWGGVYHESGVRCNVDSIVSKKTNPYLGGHCLAIGFDLKPQNKKYREFFDFVKDLIIKKELKVFIRLEDFEKTLIWIHTDGLRTKSGELEIFNP